MGRGGRGGCGRERPSHSPHHTPRSLAATAAPPSATAPPLRDELSLSQRLRAAGPYYAGRERGTKLSQSRVLSEHDMEQIELGGAAP